MLKKRRVYRLVKDESSLIAWEEIHKAEQIRVGKAGKDLLQHTVGATICYEPVMNDSGLHYSPDYLLLTEDEIRAARQKTLQRFDTTQETIIYGFSRSPVHCVGH